MTEQQPNTDIIYDQETQTRQINNRRLTRLAIVGGFLLAVVVYLFFAYALNTQFGWHLPVGAGFIWFFSSNPDAVFDPQSLLLVGVTVLVMGVLFRWSIYRLPDFQLSAFATAHGLTFVARSGDAERQKVTPPFSWPASTIVNTATGMWHGRAIEVAESEVIRIRLRMQKSVDGWVAWWTRGDVQQMPTVPANYRVSDVSTDVNKQFAIFASRPQLYFELFDPADIESMLHLGRHWRLEVNGVWATLYYPSKPNTRLVERDVQTLETILAHLDGR